MSHPSCGECVSPVANTLLSTNEDALPVPALQEPGSMPDKTSSSVRSYARSGEGRVGLELGFQQSCSSDPSVSSQLKSFTAGGSQCGVAREHDQIGHDRHDRAGTLEDLFKSKHVMWLLHSGKKWKLHVRTQEEEGAQDGTGGGTLSRTVIVRLAGVCVCVCVCV